MSGRSTAPGRRTGPKTGNRSRWGGDERSRDLHADSPQTRGLESQLDAVRKILRGEPNPLRTFADALRIQELVEAIHDSPPEGNQTTQFRLNEGRAKKSPDPQSLYETREIHA